MLKRSVVDRIASDAQATFVISKSSTASKTVWDNNNKKVKNNKNWINLNNGHGQSHVFAESERQCGPTVGDFLSVDVALVSQRLRKCSRIEGCVSAAAGRSFREPRPTTGKVSICTLVLITFLWERERERLRSMALIAIQKLISPYALAASTSFFYLPQNHA